MRLIFLLLAVATAAPAFAQSVRPSSYVVADRMAINGNQFLDPSRNAWVPTGYNEDIVTAVPSVDFGQMRDQGAKAVRISFGFLNNNDCSLPVFPVQTAKDAYNPNYPNAGYLDPVRWRKVVSAVQAAAGNGLWVDLVVSGGNCAFFNTQTLIDQYKAMWTYVARTFRKTPHIFDYEVLSEPHPSGPNIVTGYIDNGATACTSTSTPSGVAGNTLCVQSAGGNVFLYLTNTLTGAGITGGVTITGNCATNGVPPNCTGPGLTGGGGTGAYYVSGSLNTGVESISTIDGFNPQGDLDNTAVTSLCRAAFAAIRMVDQQTIPIQAVDQQTIVSCSPAKTGNSRAIAGIAMPDQSNWAANFNFFELGDGAAGAYVKQIKNSAPPYAGPYTGYPSNTGSPVAYPTYPDDKGNDTNVLCDYPNRGSSSAPLDQTFLSGILTNCPIAFSNQYAVPVYVNQVGLATWTPRNT